MKKITFSTSVKKILADAFTPVGIYLRLRDRFRDTILLESTDFHASENSYSIIGINAVGGIEIKDFEHIEFKMPGANARQEKLESLDSLAGAMADFMHRFDAEPPEEKVIQRAQGLFGYTSYDAIPFFEKIRFKSKPEQQDLSVPLLRYRLYQYVIIINHFKDEMYLCENNFPGQESKVAEVESIIRSKDVPVFPFKSKGAEATNMTDEAYMKMVEAGIRSCHRGDVFQVVLSRRFMQGFTGDEFNVYRALRSINPSPYLFYFDYGDYKLMGSSPESQVIVKNGKAIVHPIAGTVRRTGDDETDRSLALQLENDAKENAEHVMLVDLARNDLSRVANHVTVSAFKEVHYYSHVIHLVSEVQGNIAEEKNPFAILGSSFPAGTLSGAPKYKAMQIIDEQEPTARSWYGGAIGFMGLNGTCNHAIMIRTFLSKHNTLVCQAGAGVVAASQPAGELQEVNNKLGALKKAITMAESLDS